MNSILQALVVNETAVVDYKIELVHSGKSHEVSTALNSEQPERSAIRAFVSLLAAPLIALGYVVALPIIGIYQFAKLALEAWAKSHPSAKIGLEKTALKVKNIGLFLAAPFIALGYTVALPIVGLFMFSRLMHEAYSKHRNANI